jgi:hypothetical protein
MPRMGFEPTIAVFKRAGAVQALSRADTVIDRLKLHRTPILSITLNSPDTFKGTLILHEPSSKYVRIGSIFLVKRKEL